MYKNILKSTDHRGYPLPKGPWVMMQKWDHLLFLNWPVSPNGISVHIPSGLELDTYNGDAWISVIPFRVRNMRLRNMPQIPYFRTFLELNVRTYVKHQGVKGVYFFSLDASKLHAVLGARIATLPYFYARMKMEQYRDTFHYSSSRKGGQPANFKGSYQPIDGQFYPEQDSLNHWLLERYFLWTYRSGELFQAGIHHKPWKVQDAAVHIDTQTLTSFLPASSLGTQPIAHYASTKTALFWMVNKVGKV
jgi:uncharacterized protein YqjF (DUF2071 family)